MNVKAVIIGKSRRKCFLNGEATGKLPAGYENWLCVYSTLWYLVLYHLFSTWMGRRSQRRELPTFNKSVCTTHRRSKDCFPLINLTDVFSSSHLHPLMFSYSFSHSATMKLATSSQFRCYRQEGCGDTRRCWPLSCSVFRLDNEWGLWDCHLWAE